MARYIKGIAKTWHLLEKEPLLLVPKALSLAASVLLLLVLIARLRILEMLMLFSWSVGLRGVWQILLGSPLFWFYLVAEVSVLSYFSAMAFGMYKDALKGRKVSLRNGWTYGRQYFMEVLDISILYYFLIGLPLFALFYTIANPLLIDMVAQSVAILFLVLLFSYWILLVVWRMLFAYAALLFRGDELGKVMGIGAWQRAEKSVRIGANFGKLHFKHTLLTWLFVIGIALIARQVQRPALAGAMVSANPVIITIACILLAVFEIVLSTWEHLFVFAMWPQKK
ncbi:hypothetical protein AUJ68_00700 [Candidatus Woesearchaeota archaeon CG1_02_57_44]|nr:MAG: hypothetical protein AUJ68_00700 [Candidatus Woesearchaeota archaeon CG1_02_57_44]PIN68518.1 MAG: hypothetical protein COV94_04185 [Candidatus Woesearchaeota archaeon CG11_big_fil_rev_8_21_14_0_20_57_5]